MNGHETNFIRHVKCQVTRGGPSMSAPSLPIPFTPTIARHPPTPLALLSLCLWCFPLRVMHRTRSLSPSLFPHALPTLAPRPSSPPKHLATSYSSSSSTPSTTTQRPILTQAFDNPSYYNLVPQRYLVNGLLPINLAYTHERTDETKQSWLKKVSVSIQRDKADGRVDCRARAGCRRFVFF